MRPGPEKGIRYLETEEKRSHWELVSVCAVKVTSLLFYFRQNGWVWGVEIKLTSVFARVFDGYSPSAKSP